MLSLAQQDDDESLIKGDRIARTLLNYPELPINIRVSCHIVLCK